MSAEHSNPRETPTTDQPSTERMVEQARQWPRDGFGEGYWFNTMADRLQTLEFALRGLYWDQVDYLTLNKLGGMDNHWMKAAREALGIKS